MAKIKQQGGTALAETSPVPTETTKEATASPEKRKRKADDATGQATSPPAASAAVQAAFVFSHDTAYTISMATPDQISPNPYQPRTTLNPDRVRELADNIATVGLLQKPLAREAGTPTEIRFELAFGHYRIEAIKLLMADGRWKEKTIPLEVRELRDADMALIALSENRKRTDISPIEELRAVKRILDDVKGLTIQAIADGMGIDRSTLSNGLRVLALPSSVLDLVDAGTLSMHAAREFLCLMGADGHAHLDVMEEVVTEITNTRLGAAPDWRVENIRAQIRDQLAQHPVADWRRIGRGEKTQFESYGGSHTSYDPLFDIEAFKTAFQNQVHHVPFDTVRGYNQPLDKVWARMLDWTCATKEWGQWQTTAKKEQEAEQEPAPKGRASAAQRENDQALQRALARDPVAKKVVGAQVTDDATLIAQVAQEMRPNEAEVQEATALLGSPLDLVTAPAGPTGQVLASAHVRLNAWLADYAQAHPGVWPDDPNDVVYPAMEALGWLGDSPSGMRTEIGPLSQPDVYQQVQRFFQTLRRRVDKQADVHAPGKLTPDQRTALGTRASPVVEIGRAKGFIRVLGDKGGYSQTSVPFFFDDGPCRICIAGAAYAKDSAGKAVLVCTNETGFQVRVAASRAAFTVKWTKAIAQRDREDALAASDLMDKIGNAELARRLAALLLATQQFKKLMPNDGRGGRELDEFRRLPAVLQEVKTLLKLEAETNDWYAFSAKTALDALEKAKADTTRAVAANLIVAAERQVVESGRR